LIGDAVSARSTDIDASHAGRSNPVKLNERTIAGVTILDLEGRLTFTSGSDMGRRVQALLAGGTTQLLLNLEGVSYVDSAGLGAIVEAFTVSQHKAVKLKLLKPTERTRHLLEITGLARIVESFDSESAAIASWLLVADTHVALTPSEA
jgi:anti-sigma B factor antagonist